MFHEFWSALFHPICHQLKEKTLCLGNTYMPLCMRCTGIYSGFLFTMIYQLCRRSRRGVRLPPALYTVSMLIAFIFLGLDIKFKQSIITISALENGLAIGAIIAVFLLPLINRFLLRSRKDCPVMAEKGDFLWLLIIIFFLSRLNAINYNCGFRLFYFSSVAGCVALYLVLSATLFSKLFRR